MEDAIRKYLEGRESEIADFQNVTVPSKPYGDAVNRLDRLTIAFVDTHRALTLYTTRQGPLYDNSLMFTTPPDGSFAIYSKMRSRLYT